MMPRFPLIPTIVVGLAVALMIVLGFWQLDRRGQKAAQLAQLATNFEKPAMAFPASPVGDEHLFRRASAMCLEVVGWRKEGAGANGFRSIAECGTGVEGPSLLVDMGTAKNPTFQPVWKGGPVTGSIAQAPDHRPMFAGIWDRTPRTLMLVSERAAPGLTPTARPTIASVPNNHLAYAVQWFLFAAVAAIIYVLALRLRQRK